MTATFPNVAVIASAWTVGNRPR